MKNLFRLLTIFILFLAAFFPIKTAVAAEHKLESIHIHTFIHADGSATITETRKAHLTEGTENYIIIGNLGKSEILDFTVTENGVTYEFIDDWDISASREEKTFKNGIIKTSSTYELCWGIGEYGDHEYIVQYTVTNFIKQLDDAQIVFWRYINDQTNIPPENVEIVIETSRPLVDETENIWGFGFEGEINFTESKIVAYNYEPFNVNNYATVLVQFPNGSFSTEDVLNQTFEDIYDQAMVGSDYEDDSDEFPFYFIIIAIIMFGVPLLIIFIMVPIFKKVKRTKERKKLLEGSEGEYNRDLPFQHEFLDLFSLLKYMGLTKERDIFTAIFLDWMYHDKVSVIEEEKKGLFRTKKLINLKFTKPNENDESEEELDEELALLIEEESDIDDEIEIAINENSIAETLNERLYKLMYKLTDKEDILSRKSIYLANLTTKKRIAKWEESLAKNSFKFLVKEKYFQKQIGSQKKNSHKLTDKGKELQKEIYKFIQYLEDFSLVHEHEPVNVKIWDRILIWASALGMADVVLKQFKDLYPNYVVETAYPLESLPYVYIYSSVIHNTVYSSTRSTGGGGFTSGGGGGGSFGGGSGGGTR